MQISNSLKYFSLNKIKYSQPLTNKNYAREIDKNKKSENTKLDVAG